MNIPSFLNQKFNRPDLGLLVVRVVFGVLILLFGVQKLFGGEDFLKMVGGAMAMFGITKFPMVWGLLAALSETLGGLCILLGVFFRPAALLLFFTMVVATASTWGAGPVFSSYSDFIMKFVAQIDSPLTFCAVFLALLFTGPGKYAMEKGGGGRSGGGSGKRE